MHSFLHGFHLDWDGALRAPGSTGQREPTKEPKMRRAPILIASIATATVLLAACSAEGSTPFSSDDRSTSSSSPAAEGSSPSAGENAASAETITDIVAANPDF